MNTKTAWWFAGAQLLNGLAGPLKDPLRSTSKRKAMADLILDGGQAGEYG